MARRKEVISQRDFTMGATRPEAVERDDTVLIEQSAKEAKNLIGLTTGATEVRPGSVYINATDSDRGFEVDLGKGRVFDIHIVPNGVVIYDQDDAVEASFLAAPWDSISAKYGSVAFADARFWVLADPDTSSIILGAQEYPIHALVLDDAGSWSFGQMAFPTRLSGVVLQPYWNYYPTVTIQPSARTGAITLTASAGIWTAAHQGMRIRYVDQEIVLGTVVSATVINATVTEELPPTYDLTVASVSGYKVGDAVEHEILGGQGFITGISGSIITVLATVFWDGFAASDKLIAPNAKQVISVKTTVSPAATFLWDMQMLNQIHGYAGGAVRHMGRSYLSRFPGAPQAVAVSSAGFVTDFTLGSEDGDGFVETLGSNEGGDLLHVISAEDLLFLTSRGLYYQQTRDGSAVTPTTFGPVRFSKMGASDVVPVAVDDGAIFVDSVGEQIYAAMLDGDIYRSWKAKNMTKYHSHLLSTPSYLGATASGSERPEQFIYVVNSDGTAAVAQWDRDENRIGWRPWVTDGSYKAIYQAFGKTYSVVERTLNAVTGNVRERFETGVYMDCASVLLVSGAFPLGQTGVAFFGGVTADPVHLNGEIASLYFEGWDLGDYLIDASGYPIDDMAVRVTYPDYDGYLQIGIPFFWQLVPWDRRSVQTQSGLRDIKKVVKVYASVQDSDPFYFEGQEVGAYRVSEDLSIPPLARTEEIAFITGARDFYVDRPLENQRPGRFRLTKLRYKVTV